MVATKPMTAADLWDLARDQTDRLELIDGELVRMAAVGGRHARVGSRLDRRLGVHVEARHLGEMYVECGFQLFDDAETVTVPDFAFIRADRVPTGDDEIGYLRIVPQFVAEVVSPSNTAEHVTKKVALYLAVGVTLVWVLRPVPRTVTVYRPGAEPVTFGPDDTLDGGDLFPEFSILVSDLFG